MSLPRPVYPGQSYLATRRCVNREFRLRPSKKTNQAFWYLLGYCAKKHNIALYAALAMSNHCHLDVGDHDGTYPDFLRDFYGLLARCLNALYGDFDYLWDSAQPSMVRLGDSDDLLDKIIYTLTNPVKDDLVSRAHTWPGATSVKPMLDGKPIVAKRPDWFFRKDDKGGRMPEQIEIRFVRPPGYEHLSQDQWTAVLRSRIAKVEMDCEQRRAVTKKRVVGVAAILRHSRRATPSSPNARFGLSPRVAARDYWRRIEIFNTNKTFVAAHADARKNCTNGRLAVFPYGTWAMHRYHDAAVAQSHWSESASSLAHGPPPD